MRSLVLSALSWFLAAACIAVACGWATTAFEVYILGPQPGVALLASWTSATLMVLGVLGAAAPVVWAWHRLAAYLRRLL